LFFINHRFLNRIISYFTVFKYPSHRALTIVIFSGKLADVGAVEFRFYTVIDKLFTVKLDGEGYLLTAVFLEKKLGIFLSDELGDISVKAVKVSDLTLHK